MVKHLCVKTNQEHVVCEQNVFNNFLTINRALKCQTAILKLYECVSLLILLQSPQPLEQFILYGLVLSAISLQWGVYWSLISTFPGREWISLKSLIIKNGQCFSTLCKSQQQRFLQYVLQNTFSDRCKICSLQVWSFEVC